MACLNLERFPYCPAYELLLWHLLKPSIYYIISSPAELAKKLAGLAEIWAQVVLVLAYLLRAFLQAQAFEPG